MFCKRILVINILHYMPHVLSHTCTFNIMMFTSHAHTYCTYGYTYIYKRIYESTTVFYVSLDVCTDLATVKINHSAYCQSSQYQSRQRFVNEKVRWKMIYIYMYATPVLWMDDGVWFHFALCFISTFSTQCC